jgi:hypothetical protein
LIYLNIMLPKFLKLSMSQFGKICLIKFLKVVKESFHEIFVEIIVWKQFVHGHKNGIAALIMQKM